MAVSLVGAVGTAQTTVTTGTTITGAYGQSPTAGNLLVALISRVGATATASPVSSGATGWQRLLPTNFVTNIGVGSATACTNLVDVWYRVALGGDATPTFTMTLAGGTTSTVLTCVIYELSGANNIGPLHVSGTQSSGGTTSTITSTTTTTSSNVTIAGGFSISIATRERTAGTTTVTYSASWTNGFNDGATSQVEHTGVASLANPGTGATSSDVTSWSGTGTTSFGCGAIVTIGPAVTYGAARSPSAQGSPSDAGANSVHAGTFARLPVRGQVQGITESRFQNAPQTDSSQQPAGIRVIYQRAGAISATQVFPPPPPPVPATFYPHRRPSASRARGFPRRGRCTSMAALFPGYLGPPVTPADGPVRARITPPPRGRAQGRAGTFTFVAPGTPATFYPLGRAVQARVPLPPRGVSRTMVGVPQFIAGPPVTPWDGPIRSRITPPPRGRAQGHAGVVTAVAPVLATVYPLRHPVSAVVRPLPVRGRSQGHPGVFSQTGVPFPSMDGPVQARRPLPRKGTAAWRYGTFTPITSVTVFYPARRPVAAVTRPLPKAGRVFSNEGTFQGTGAPLVQLRRPVAAVVRVLAPRGRTSGNDGVFGQAGPKVTPLRGPVAARTRPLPPRGTAQGRAGVFSLVIQSGPPIYPLRKPAAAVIRPQPPRGRAQGHAGVFRGSGPAVKPLQHPVYAWRPGPRRGVCLTSVTPPPAGGLGSKFYPFRRPVQARQPLPPRGQSLKTPPYVPPIPPVGGHGYPYQAVLAPARWSAFAVDARWPAALTPGRWFANGPS